MATPPDQNFVPPPPAATGDVDPLPAHPVPPHHVDGSVHAAHSPTLLNHDLTGLANSAVPPPTVQGDFAPTVATMTNDPTQLAVSPTNNTAATDPNESVLVDNDSKKRPRDDEAGNAQEEVGAVSTPPPAEGGIKNDSNGGTNSNISIVVKKPIKRKRSSVGGGGSTSYGGGRNGGSSSSDNWNDMLFELLKFRAKKGHCNVPKTGPLGRWVARQRLLKPKNVGTASNISGGGSGGTTPGATAGVGANMAAAKDGSNGVSNTANSTTPLSKASSSRDDNDGSAVKRNYLSQERIDVLESIGFVWDPVQADYDEKWKKRFDELVEFVRVNGHFSVSQTTRKSFSLCVCVCVCVCVCTLGMLNAYVCSRFVFCAIML